MVNSHTNAGGLSYSELAAKSRLLAALAHFEVRLIDPEACGARAAAVALVVVEHPEPAVLLTRRSVALRRHAGQFALPGGRLDPGESVETAARRELREELGLELAASDQVGRLDDCLTRSGFVISTLVFHCHTATTLAPNPDEVAAVYRVPLSELMSDAIPHFEANDAGDHTVLYADLPSVGTSVYAPTAAILFQFRELALFGRHTRIEEFEQPEFAWR